MQTMHVRYFMKLLLVYDVRATQWMTLLYNNIFLFPFYYVEFQF